MSAAPHALLEALLDVTPARFVERPCEPHGVLGDCGTCRLEASVQSVRDVLPTVSS